MKRVVRSGNAGAQPASPVSLRTPRKQVPERVRGPRAPRRSLVKPGYAQPPPEAAAELLYRPKTPGSGVLFQVIQRDFATFRSEREAEERPLPRYIEKEFEAYIRCGVLGHGFVRLKCNGCTHEKLLPFSCKKRGFCPSCLGRRMAEASAFYVDHVLPQAPIRQWVFSFPMPLRFWMAKNPRLLTRILGISLRTIRSHYQKKSKRTFALQKPETASLTVVQRFGGALNLNVHYHSLWVEGVYEEGTDGVVKFHALSPPTDLEVKQILTRVQTRIIRALKKEGLLSEVNRSGQIEFILSAPSDTPDIVEICQSASILSQIATGEYAGTRVRRIGSFGHSGEDAFLVGPRCAELAGFSLHSYTGFAAHQRLEIERLCRYVMRPPVAESRLAITSNPNLIHYRFKRPWSDGTQAVEFTGRELIEKLVALVPPPRAHLVRFHGALAPHSRLRSRVIPASVTLPSKIDETGEQVQSRPKRRVLSWSELLKRVFEVDLSICPSCGGTLKFIAAVVHPSAIRAILEHLGHSTEVPRFAPARAPPRPQEPIWED